MALRAVQEAGENEDLSLKEVQWIMREESNETKLMKFVPASGGRPLQQWLIRQGNYISLGELFTFGKNLCSCWDMYRTYKSLDIFIHKRAHSRSESEAGIMRQNAKRWHHQRTGRWGLPSR